MMIEQLHLSYLQTDENLHKIEQRKKLEGSLVYLISFIYQYNKWNWYITVLLQCVEVYNIILFYIVPGGHMVA